MSECSGDINNFSDWFKVGNSGECAKNQKDFREILYLFYTYYAVAASRKYLVFFGRFAQKNFVNFYRVTGEEKMD